MAGVCEKYMCQTYPINVLKTQVNSMDTTHSVAINFYVRLTLDIW